MPYETWKLVHILLFVYWLGADLGVLLLAKRVKDASLDLEQRLLLLEMATLIDLLPRLCFAAMLPVGLEMANRTGLMETPVLLRVAVWVLAIAWIALIIAMTRNEGNAKLAFIQRMGLFVVSAVLIVAGVMALGSTDATGWLAAKLVIYGIICLAAVGIDWSFQPLVPALARLASEGSSPDVEQAITASIDRTVIYVYVLYGALVIAAILGVLKPF